MTITNFNDLREWFKFGFEKGANAKEEGRETSSPYWTLYSVGMGGKDTILAFNDRLTSLDESLTALVENIRRMNNPSGSTFRIFQTYKPRFNYATQEAKVQIFENNQFPVGGNPGIGSLPVGYVPEDAIQKAVDAAKEKWDMEARIQALENQEEDGLLEKVERIAAIPAVQAVINAFMLKQGLPPLPQPAVNGTHTRDNAAPPADDNTDNFDDDIDATAKIIGVSDSQLAARLRRLAEADPEMARQIFNQ